MSVAGGEINVLELPPSPSRVDEIDSLLRLRLADSFEYLGGLPWFEPGRRVAVFDLIERLSAGPVSPWVFCLYSRLVTQLSARNGFIGETLDALATAVYLPAGEGVMKLLDSTIPSPWWQHLQLLLDTDRSSPCRPVAPTTEQFIRCQQDISGSLDLIRRVDPVWHDEVTSLLRSIVLGSHSNSDPSTFFNGASTFFLWGATLLNANVNRATVSMIDLLIHESSHVLLFGLSANESLTRNDGEERYDSPVRADKRPIDGIFHACYVTTRVHLAMKRLLSSGSLSKDEIELAIQRSQHNEKAARESLAVLTRHADSTRLGKAILHELENYWANKAGR
jgi:hypothetical protein